MCIDDAGVHTLSSTPASWLNTSHHLHPSQQYSHSFVLRMTNECVTADQPQVTYLCIYLHQICFFRVVPGCACSASSVETNTASELKFAWLCCRNLHGSIRGATLTYHLCHSCLPACTLFNLASWNVMHVANKSRPEMLAVHSIMQLDLSAFICVCRKRFMLAQRHKLSCSWNTYSLAGIKVLMTTSILMGNVIMMVAVMTVHLQATLGTTKLDQDSLD